MKHNYLLLLLLGIFLTAEPSSASNTYCDIANIKACVLNLDGEEMLVGVHNSGRGYDGLQIYTNQNHGLSIASVFDDIDVLIDGRPATVESSQNVVTITDESGVFPWMFIVNIRMVSKTGETIQNIVTRNLGAGINEKPMLVAVPILSEN